MERLEMDNVRTDSKHNVVGEKDKWSWDMGAFEFSPHQPSSRTPSRTQPESRESQSKMEGDVDFRRRRPTADESPIGRPFSTAARGTRTRRSRDKPQPQHSLKYLLVYSLPKANCPAEDPKKPLWTRHYKLVLSSTIVG
jgi:hypothetical protein